MSKRLAWRRLGWSSVVVVALVLGLAVMLQLRTREQQVQAEPVEVTVHVRGASDGEALLARRGDRWVGRASDFPPGSVADVQPRGSPGFFLVRDPGGSFHALSDRSPHRGQPLEFRDPLPGTSNHAVGPQPGFYDPDAGANHTLDGEPFQGPAPRSLDPFPLALQDEHVEIATHALCPPDLTQPPAWCGSGEGPRALAAGQVIVLLPPGAQLRVLGGPVPSETSSCGPGAPKLSTPLQMELLAVGGARVLWLHEDALSLVDQAWVRSQYDQGRAVGVLNGTIADLSYWFGLGENSPAWIQPGSSRPVFALVQQRRCEETQSSGTAQTSEWLSLGFWVAVSQRAATPCSALH